MRVLYAFFLSAIHFIYAIILLIRSFWQRNSAPAPQPLRTSRQHIPKHLAIVFNVDPAVSRSVAQEIVTESVVDAVSWCRTVGIGKLTVYEENDLLSKCTHNIRKRLPIHGQEPLELSDSETEYPITPPASEYSESRPLSPDTAQEHDIPFTTMLVADPISRSEIQKPLKLQRRRQNQIVTEAPKKRDLLLCLASWKCSKPAIARAAQELAEMHARDGRKTSRSGKHSKYKLSIDELHQILEEDDGLSSPDFMIIHPVESSSAILAPPELHGFPPWHIRLTEIYQNKPPKSRLQRLFRLQWSHLPAALDETSFRSALDEFTSAEMRFGK